MAKRTDEIIQQLAILQGHISLHNSHKLEAQSEKQQFIHDHEQIPIPLRNKLAHLDKEIFNLHGLLAITRRKYTTFLRYAN